MAFHVPKTSKKPPLKLATPDFEAAKETLGVVVSRARNSGKDGGHAVTYSLPG